MSNPTTTDATTTDADAPQDKFRDRSVKAEARRRAAAPDHCDGDGEGGACYDVNCPDCFPPTQEQPVVSANAWLNTEADHLRACAILFQPAASCSCGLAEARADAEDTEDALQTLRAAARGVIAAWEDGDLAGSVRLLSLALGDDTAAAASPVAPSPV